MRRLSVLAVALGLVVSCGAEEASPGDPGGPAAIANGSKSDCAGCADPAELTPVPATLVFSSHAEPREQLTGALYAGGRALIAHHPDRFTHCEVSRTTGYLRGEDGEVVSFAAAGWPDGDRVSLPASGARVELWFSGESADGSCQEWDSQGGDNFVFELHGWAPTLLKFAADWSEIAIGVPGEGGTLVIDYDLARLTACRATMYGQAAWSILAYVQFDTGEQLEAPVTAGVSSGGEYQMGPALANFLIPPGATEAQLWFLNQDAAACTAYDSNYGRNYVIGIR